MPPVRTVPAKANAQAVMGRGKPKVTPVATRIYYPEPEVNDEPEKCPLCVEDLDDTDLNFQPCPCGYRVCLFCYEKLKQLCNSTCPNCRRVYGNDSSQDVGKPTAGSPAVTAESYRAKPKTTSSASLLSDYVNMNSPVNLSACSSTNSANTSFSTGPINSLGSTGNAAQSLGGRSLSGLTPRSQSSQQLQQYPNQLPPPQTQSRKSSDESAILKSGSQSLDFPALPSNAGWAAQSLATSGYVSSPFQSNGQSYDQEKQQDRIFVDDSTSWPSLSDSNATFAAYAVGQSSAGGSSCLTQGPSGAKSSEAGGLICESSHRRGSSLSASSSGAAAERSGLPLSSSATAAGQQQDVQAVPVDQAPRPPQPRSLAPNLLGSALLASLKGRDAKACSVGSGSAGSGTGMGGSASSSSHASTLGTTAHGTGAGRGTGAITTETESETIGGVGAGTTEMARPVATVELPPQPVQLAASVTSTVKGVRRTFNVPLSQSGGVEPYREGPEMLSSMHKAVKEGSVSSQEAAAQLLALLRQKDYEQGARSKAIPAPPGFSAPGSGSALGRMAGLVISESGMYVPSSSAATAFASSSGMVQQTTASSFNVPPGFSLLNSSDNPVVSGPPPSRFTPISPPSNSAPSCSPSPGLQQQQQGATNKSFTLNNAAQQMGSESGGTYSMWSGLPGIDLGTAAAFFSQPGATSGGVSRSSYGAAFGAGLGGFLSGSAGGGAGLFSQSQAQSCGALTGLGQVKQVAAVLGMSTGNKAPPPGFGGSGLSSVGPALDLVGGDAARERLGFKAQAYASLTNVSRMAVNVSSQFRA